MPPVEVEKSCKAFFTSSIRTPANGPKAKAPIKAGKSEKSILAKGGDSGTGKTVLYEMLEDIRLTDEYKAIKLFNYKSDDFLKAIKQCRDSFIVVDNADYLINDDIRRFINFEFSNQYMLFLRNCDGLNVSDKSFKVLKFDNNRITLEEEL